MRQKKSRVTPSPHFNAVLGDKREGGVIVVSLKVRSSIGGLWGKRGEEETQKAPILHSHVVASYFALRTFLDFPYYIAARCENFSNTHIIL